MGGVILKKEILDHTDLSIFIAIGTDSFTFDMSVTLIGKITSNSLFSLDSYMHTALESGWLYDFEVKPEFSPFSLSLSSFFHFK